MKKLILALTMAGGLSACTQAQLSEGVTDAVVVAGVLGAACLLTTGC